ncbi:MAG: hypothetical protein LBT42_05620, partial [Tannerella sp.]|nr:hypothetical protein [Tannerella sp.]
IPPPMTDTATNDGYCHRWRIPPPMTDTAWMCKPSGLHRSVEYCIVSGILQAVGLQPHLFIFHPK